MAADAAADTRCQNANSYGTDKFVWNVQLPIAHNKDKMHNGYRIVLDCGMYPLDQLEIVNPIVFCVWVWIPVYNKQKSLNSLRLCCNNRSQ